MSRTSSGTPGSDENTTRQHQSDDEDVPPSERGKEESMSFDRKEPSAVFGLVGLSYLMILLLIVGVIVAFLLL